MPGVASIQTTLLLPTVYHPNVAPQALESEVTTKPRGDWRLRELLRKASYTDSVSHDQFSAYGSPDHAPFVRELFIRRTDFFALETMEPIIAELSSVNTLSLQCPDGHPTQRLRLETWYLCFVTQTRQLTSLTLDGFCFRTFSDLTYVLKSCPELKTLALRNLVWPGITGPETVICEDSMQPELVTDGNGLGGAMSYKHQCFANAENWRARLSALQIECGVGRATDVVANWLYHSCPNTALETAHFMVGFEDSLPGVEVEMEADSESEDLPGHADLLLASQTTLSDLTLHVTCDKVTDWEAMISFYDGFLSDDRFTSLRKVRIVGVVADTPEHPAITAAGWRASMTALLAREVEVSVEGKSPES